MPVDSCHPSQLGAIDRWKLIRDCIEGDAAMKEGGTLYLPMLGSQESDPASYLAYKERSLFFNATNRTHDALLGFLFRKPPMVQLGPEKSKTPVIPEVWQADIDLGGNTIEDYARMVGDDVASVGRAGTLIDFTTDDGLNRPVFRFYAAENVINWRAKAYGGRMLLTLLTLEETIESESGDEFERPVKTQYRVFRLTDTGVEVELHTGREKMRNQPNGPQDVATSEDFDVKPLGLLRRRGIPLMEIPFEFHNADHIGPDIGISPLYDLAVVNKSHFQTSADYENACHFLGHPTLYAFGLTSGGKPVPAEKLYLGGPAWVADNVDAKVGFIEFTGQGLQNLKENLERKMAQMAAIGARMIEPKQGDAEAFETVALRASSETSALASMASFLSRSLTQCLKWFVWWDGTEASVQDVQDVNFQINRDFVSARMQPAEMDSMLRMVEAGKMSYETFFFNLQRADMLPPGRTLEEEMDAIETTLVDMPRPTPPPLPVDPNAPPIPDPNDPNAPPAGDKGPPAAKKFAAKKAAKKAAGKPAPDA